MPEKVILFLTDEAFDALTNTTWAEALSHTDIVSRAIVVYAKISAAQPGEVLPFTDGKDGSPWKSVKVL